MNGLNIKPLRKKTLVGVVFTGSGSIAYAKIQMKNGRCTAKFADSWPTSNIIKTMLRLLGGAILGASAKWRAKTSDLGLEPPVHGANADINPYLRSVEFDILAETLSGSVTSVVTDDSFLLTLPLAFCDNPASSFLSVYLENDIVVMGVVIMRRLEAVFSFPRDAASCVGASAARVKRYWTYMLKRDDFPRKAVVFNGQNDDCDGLDVEPLTLPNELNGSGIVKAAGAALTALYCAPTFKLPPEHTFRIFRPILLSVSAALLSMSVIVALLSVSMSGHAGNKLAHSEKNYRLRLNENMALQALDKTAGELSAEILSINKAYSQTTGWGNLLSFLSEIKPADLFLERLGSDNIQGSDNSVRLALSGWSKAETSVTDFISGLQTSTYIGNVSLSSIERDTKDKNICRFKIICVMRLFKD